ncbi:GTP-binding protein Rit1-like protein [Leptotrombidium deliense]|uniref:small monomeric GTPase n=1 Tax=Leptotrombidium deliense TaxID=299467 RepID=A0A443STM4_9ACAR|nr:GTP-binding protein Rit1-like protein [Leptotrombidium deliense]
MESKKDSKHLTLLSFCCTSVDYNHESSERYECESQILNGDVQTSAPCRQMGARIYKVVVLGEGGVGKSALTLQFVTHSFLEAHDPTIEDSYQRQVVVDGEVAMLDILDTAGQVEFTAMREQYMRCGEGFIICYSIDNRRSFEEASHYFEQIQNLRGTNIPIVLVGNKCDLNVSRKVSFEEGRSLAVTFSCPFHETSAALKHHVDDVFFDLVREIRSPNKKFARKVSVMKSNKENTQKRWRLTTMFLSLFSRLRRK